MTRRVRTYFGVFSPSKIVIYQRNLSHFSMKSWTKHRQTHTNTSTLWDILCKCICDFFTVHLTEKGAMISFPKKWYAEFLSKYILARELEIKIFWIKIFSWTNNGGCWIIISSLYDKEIKDFWVRDKAIGLSPLQVKWSVPQ